MGEISPEKDIGIDLFNFSWFYEVKSYKIGYILPLSLCALHKYERIWGKKNISDAQ